MSMINAKSIGICCISLLSGTIYAEQSGFYSIIGPDGHIIIIDRNAQPAASRQQADVKPEKSRRWSLFGQSKLSKSAATADQQSIPSPVTVNTIPAKAAPVPTVTQQPVVITPAIPVPAKVIPQRAQVEVTPRSLPVQPVDRQLAANQQASAQSQQPAVTSSPVQVVDGQEYIDSEYLEQREFNLEGKKRFYSLPDGIGGQQILQREKGIDMNIFRGSNLKIKQPQVVTLAKDYQRLTRQQVIDLTGIECFGKQQLKKAKLLKLTEPLNFWPKPGFEPKFDFVVAQLKDTITDIQFTSYASNTNAPEFYWPLPIFLDEKGCVLEGVNAFYQRDLPATITSHQGVQGYLHLPEKTHYVLLTPLESAADMGQQKLANTGQVTLTPVR